MIFRLAGANMYTDMRKECHNPTIDRAIALHKMIRLFTMAAGGEAYLNFMGNEFGHPEWIDFPREGNGWSFHYCRRQWSLTDNPDLKYEWLNNFDHDMVHIAKSVNLFEQRWADLRLKTDFHQKVIVFTRKELMFAFNFHHDWSQWGVKVPVLENADYTVDFSSDDWSYGGFGQVHRVTCPAKRDEDGSYYIELYIPARTAIVLRRGEVRPYEPIVEEPAVEETPVVEEAPAVEAVPEEAVNAVPFEEAPVEQTPAEAPKPKRTRKPKAETPAEEKPKRTRKKKTEEAAEEKPKATRKPRAKKVKTEE
jgi:hypothetical protein